MISGSNRIQHLGARADLDLLLDPSQDRIERFLSKIAHVHYYESVNDDEGQNEFQPYRPGRSDTNRLVASRIYDACCYF